MVAQALPRAYRFWDGRAMLASDGRLPAAVLKFLADDRLPDGLEASG